MSITFAKVSVDSLVNRSIVAIVNDGPGQAAEDRLDHIEKLRAGWKRCRVNLWAVAPNGGVVGIDMFEQPFRDVPGGSIPRKIKLGAIAVLCDECLQHTDHFVGVFFRL
ncbi:hypothetical protein [Bradyrhizobium sp. NAS96.2]|uniref:hypothetical protein n=1 Tax=Bradyrhizobium sp. NAS96.2 TaxID=1680160 RepID=UPI0032DF8D2D